VLSNAEYPFFIPYYAFLPDGEGNPRERGEALTFFQDVIDSTLAIQKSTLCRPGKRGHRPSGN
jgi:hypothetical protein